MKKTHECCRATLATTLFLGIIALPVFAPTALAAGGYPGAEWPTGTPESQGMSTAKLNEAKNYAMSSGGSGGSGMIIRHGVVVMRWGSQTERYDLKSTTKSFGATMLGIAIAEGKVRMDDKAATLIPNFGIPPSSNAGTGWLNQVTLRHLATQTAGFEKTKGYGRITFAPGTDWLYSDGGPNWLAEAITRTYRQDINTLMFNRVFTPIGIQPSDLVWRENSARAKTVDGIPNREFGAGISANVDAMARFGYLYLHGGRWENTQILQQSFVESVGKKDTQVPGASSGYGLLWWTNQSGRISGIPRDAYWTSGLFGSHILVIPSLDIVAVRAGDLNTELPRGPSPLFIPIVQSVTGPGNGGTTGGGTTGGVTSPTVNLSASPSSVSAGNSATLSWSSQNASSCTGSGFSTGGNTSGSVSVSPANTTTYTISCTGAGGSVSDSATVTVTQSSPTACLVYQSNSSAPNGYGASWDVFSFGKELLVKTNCPASGTALTFTVGKGDAIQYVWNEAYTYEGGWVKKILTGTQSSGWIAGQGTAQITAPSNTSASNPFYFVGYVCTNRGAAGWKCGCTNTSCTTPSWQLQAYTGASGSATTGNGTTGTTQQVATPSISPNGATFTTTQSVTLSTNTAGATIRYTTDNSTPISTSPQYTSPLTLSQTTTIKAQAFKAGMTDSSVTSAVFTKGGSGNQSTAIKNVVFASASSEIHLAEESDNWPVTWADDDNIYTAYGDGFGFTPRVPEKLSMGFAKVAGTPPSITGTNIRAPGAETVGNDVQGKKASGMLMVDGTLYAAIRNANSGGTGCQLAWSTDYSKSWTWSSWKFNELGYCALLNFGKNYANARDEYVYMYSPNTNSAYDETDSYILARVPKAQIKDKAAYEFYTGMNGTTPSWGAIGSRAPILTIPGSANRIDVAYNAPLQRYVMASRARAQAGGNDVFLMYEAPEPWGPWTRIYQATGASATPWGEAIRIPTKWISADGKTFYVIHAGSDRFNVRKGTFEL